LGIESDRFGIYELKNNLSDGLLVNIARVFLNFSTITGISASLFCSQFIGSNLFLSSSSSEK
jgi:hypothetical protein